jgi:hypothetical protein
MSYQISYLFLGQAVLLKIKKNVNLFDGTWRETHELPTWNIVLFRKSTQNAKNHKYTIQTWH